MIKTGLTSVTFRKLPAEEIVRLVGQTGLQGIEWGGDVHVPHGDVRRARQVRQLTLDAGLEVSSYGSYYRVGCGDAALPFEAVLETALALGAKVIRVWAGDRGSAEADPGWWDAVVADARRIAALSGQAGVTTAFEYHEETLTDTASSAGKLMEAIGQEAMRCYWQPPVGLDHSACLASLKAISPWLSQVHVFHMQDGVSAPLDAGAGDWADYLEVIQALPGVHYCLLEFVKDESPRQFLADAQALTRFCARNLKDEAL
jgi:sugar phosphate isomerase/epimerase